MPLLATAVAAGKAAFSLIPKNKEARKKAAEKDEKKMPIKTIGGQKLMA